MSREKQTAEAENMEQMGEATKESGKLAEVCAAAEPMKACVYCGPSVRGVARQYTVYTVGIPKALTEFFKEHPEAEALLVPVDRFARTRKALETAGTAEAIIFNKVRSEL